MFDAKHAKIILGQILVHVVSTVRGKSFIGETSVQWMRDHEEDMVIDHRSSSQLNIFLTWLLGSDDLPDHGWDHVPQLVFGADNTPAVPLVTLLLITNVLLNHLLDTGDTQTAVLNPNSSGK